MLGDKTSETEQFGKERDWEALAARAKADYLARNPVLDAEPAEPDDVLLLANRVLYTEPIVRRVRELGRDAGG